MRAATATSAAAMAVLAACGGSSSGAATSAAATVDAGGDAPPLPPSAGAVAPCPAGTWPDGDGRCEAAGVPASACGADFVPDGDGGCTPVLPAAPCPDGQVAWLGETACHEIADCGDGTWGNIPVTASTVFVDGAFRAADADGSAERPWPTVQDGVDHAPAGALVAIAAGTYDEHVHVVRPLRLWGRCPRLVTIAATGPVSTVVVNAPGSELHALHVRSSFAQVAVQTNGATLDALDVEGNSGCLGVVGETSVTHVHARGGNAGVSVFAGGPTRIAIDRSILSGGADGANGVGSTGNADAVVVHATIIEGFQTGIAASGAVLVEGSYFRDLSTSAVFVASSEEAAILGSVVERCGDGAIIARDGTRVRVADTTLRDIGNVAAAGALLTDARYGTPATIDVERVRLTHPHYSGMIFGSAVTATVRGLYVSDVVADDSGVAYGIIATSIAPTDNAPAAGAPTRVTIEGSVVRGTAVAGIAVEDAEVVLRGTVVDATRALPNGGFGDGASVVRHLRETSLRTDGVVVSGAARAGIASFGAVVSLGDTRIVAAAVDLDGETNGGTAAVFSDQGGNVCASASGAETACVVLSAHLAPPSIPE